MGEIADSLINGEFDCYTGEYIGKPVGYPRTHVDKSSFHYISKNNSKAGFEAQNRNGVFKYLKSLGFAKEIAPSIVKEYCTTQLNMTTTNFTKHCIEIQKDFKKFVKYMKDYIKPTLPKYNK